MPTFDTPGVYIQELTGPGVIAGVGTSTAAFIGPAKRGPLFEAVQITSFDEFLEQFAFLQPDGTFQPFITEPRLFHLPFAVSGFFQNGGRRAFIVRVGTAKSATWTVNNRAATPEPVFRVQARAEGTAGNNLAIVIQIAHKTGDAGVAMANGKATVVSVFGVEVKVSSDSPFREGDLVTKDQINRAKIDAITADVLRLSKPLTLAMGDELKIADLATTETKFRLRNDTDRPKLSAGSVVRLYSNTSPDPAKPPEGFAIVDSVDRAGFVTLAGTPQRTKTFPVETSVLVSEEFRLLVTPSGGSTETFDNLSLDPRHPGYVFTAVRSDLVRILPPLKPPVAINYPDRLVAAATPAANPLGEDDKPGALRSSHFEDGLKVLRDIDDVNIVCIPDAAAHPDRVSIQRAAKEHCEDEKLRDRFAVLDSVPGAPPDGPGSVEEQRKDLDSEKGFAALYYPWLEVRDPFSQTIPPRTIFIPPSGHIAGVYARTDQERGVHKAPANTDVRGILGLERVLSDREQGPLNENGVNVLRIFPNSNSVIVWGARTTAPKNVTDFRYVPVRRLLLFIEESIEEGIRFAVFEPNNLALWQKLKRTISEFLTRVWRDGALFGDSPDKAFSVRIDEGLNPPSVRALGQLFIEIGVAAVRPAEFIIVRIGLRDDGASFDER